MRRRLFHILVGVVWVLLPLYCFAQVATGQKSLRVYFVGNSVTDTINYRALAELAKSRGYKHVWGRHMIPGAPLQWIWEHPKDGFQEPPFGHYPKALADYQWDVLSLQPFDRHLTGKDGDLTMARNFIDLALPKSPDLQVYVYARWPRQGKNDFDTMWLKNYTGGWDGTNETKDYFERLTLELRKAYPKMKRPILMVPVGHVMYELNQRMKTGEVPGYKQIMEVYADGIHLNNVGSYIVGCTFFATLYRENPKGLPGQPYKVTDPKLAEIIQETVWKLVSTHELSGVRPPTASRAPYPPSPVIKSLTIEPERFSFGDGDNWPITWADDDAQYTVYCDGKGFGGGSGEGSMSLARILGTPPNITGENIVSATGHKTGGGPEGRKASGLLMVDGVLYMWVRNFKNDGTGSSLAWSKDHATTWTWADWSFPEIGYPVWMNAGRNYDAAQDDFAYMVSPDTPSAYKTSDHILLARVAKDRITTKDAYQFFAGLDESSKPRWTASFQDRKPVFTDPGHCYRPEVVYNPGLKRYLLCTATSGSPKWCGTDEKYLGIFDAPHPWGPWTGVMQIEGWGGEENRFQPRVPAKWISQDGGSFYLLYSCFPKGPYKFNVQKCAIKTADSPGSQPAALDRRQQASGFDVITKKKEDQVKIQVEGGKAIFSISSPSGIGSATIKPRTEQWPAAVILRLHLRGLESLRITNGKATAKAFVTTVGDPTVHCFEIHDGKEKPVGGDSASWMDIRMLDAKGAPKNKIPLEDGYFEVVVPKAMLREEPGFLTVTWIDFHRG